MHLERCGGPAHEATAAWVLTTGLVCAAAMGAGHACAQPMPAAGAAPSEAVQRQASSPYRFILQLANTPVRGKPAPAPVPAPSAAVPGRGSAGAEAKAPARAVERVQPVETARPTEVHVAPAPAASAAPPAPEPEALSAAPVADVPPPRLEVIPVSTQEPRLPAALQRQRPSGVVRVQFELQTDGSTAAVKVISSTNHDLNRASVDAVANWKFQPVDEVLTIETELAYRFD